MHERLLQIAGGLLIVLGVFLARSAVRQWRRARRLENYPASKAHSAAIGYVELSAEVQAGPAVTAPFSGKSCVHSRWEVTANATGQTLDAGSIGGAFFVQDATGSLRVDPDGGEMIGGYSYQITTNDSSSFIPDPGVKAWLAKRPQVKLRGDIRFTEWAIQAGQSLFLTGELSTSETGRTLRRATLSIPSERSLLSDAHWQVPIKWVATIALLLAGIKLIVPR